MCRLEIEELFVVSMKKICSDWLVCAFLNRDIYTSHTKKHEINTGIQILMIVKLFSQKIFSPECSNRWESIQSGRNVTENWRLC